MKKSFLLYCDTYDTIKHLTDDDLGRLMRMIFEYQINNIVPNTKDPLYIAFGFIRTSMDRDADKWEQRAERARVNGLKGGRPKTNQDGLEETQKTHSVISKPTKPVSVSVSVSDSVSVNDNINYKNMDSNQFKQELAKHRGAYSDEMLRQFFIYWSEEDAKGKMRFQLEKTWSIKGRLVRWQLNNKQESKPSQEPKSRAWNT
ncbi:MAG: DUF6291 domain-containing protein [Bacteroidota bacterium]